MKYLLFLILIHSCLLYAQIIGVGTDFNVERADQKAIADLSSQLSVQVQVNFYDLQKETDGKLEEVSEKMVKTYSNVFLENVRKEVSQLADGQFRVKRILTEEDREKVFQQRYRKICQYARNGLRAEAKGDAGEALKNYYWALLLLKSHPDRNHLINEEKEILDIWLPAQIQDVIKNVRLEMSHRSSSGDMENVQFKAMYKNKPAISLKLSYFDGVRVTETFIKDGNGSLLLPAKIIQSKEDLLIGIDYEYLHQLQSMPQDQEVKSIIEYLPRVPFENLRKLSFGAIKKAEKKPDITNLDVDKQAILETVLNYINDRKQKEAKQHFSERGWKQFNKMLAVGKVTIANLEKEINFYPLKNQIMIRSIPLQIQTQDRNRRIFQEDMVLLLENGKIEWCNFAVNDHILEETLSRGKGGADLEERLQSIQFLEYYKTCFALKDDEKIAQIFSEDALIFVGYVKGIAPVSQEMQDVIQKTINSPEVRIKQYSKEVYMKNLQHVFDRNEAINLNFKELEIAKKQKDIYAVQIKQDYYSTTYSDQGYLLLFYDMRDKDKPQIFFRYWQQSKLSENEWEELNKLQGAFRF